jgi:hypothetical protein
MLFPQQYIKKFLNIVFRKREFNKRDREREKNNKKIIKFNKLK